MKCIVEKSIAFRQYLHQNPELSWEEYETTKLVAEMLSELNIETSIFPRNTGLIATIKGEKAGTSSTIALRADIDALPLKENTSKPYQSTKESIMHACGHDGHTAVLLGTAMYLNEHKDMFPHTVKLIFQPSEEMRGGAEYVIEQGALKSPDVDTIVGLHAAPEIELGKIGLKEGALMASTDEFKVTIFGVGGHGAYPHLAKDPIQPACKIISELQSMLNRRYDCNETIVVSTCYINSGTAMNIIPAEASIGGTIRCQNEAIRKTISKEMENVIKHICEMYGCSYEFEYDDIVPVLENDSDTIKFIKSFFPEEMVTEVTVPRMGSEDFAFYSNSIKKSAMIRLGITPVGQEMISLHNPKFDFNDDAVAVGIKLFSEYVINFGGK